jgi:LuxR family maltose regulon positive regulatory protein
MPLHFRGGVNQVLNWLASQPADVLDARPMLWVMYASALSIVGQTIHSEEKLRAAEAALEKFELDPYTRNLIGHIAAIRSVLALSQHDAETIMAQSVRALEYLHPNNLPVRTATIWKIGYAHQLRGERTDALRAYIEAIALAEASGNTLIHNSALIGLGNIQESHNQLHLAVQTYERSLQLSGDPPMGIACETHLGMARICYEWNDLEAAQNHIQLSLQLSRHLDHMDRFVAGELFLVRLRLAQDDMPGALAVLARASQSAHQHRFVLRYPDVAAVQVLTLLRQGNLTAAAQIAQEANTPPYSQARIVLAQGDSHTALTLLERLRLEAESRLWQDQRLRVMVLQALAYRAHGDKDKSLDMLADALAIAGPEGFIRTFIDEGAPMVRLLSEARVAGLMSNYVNQLLAAAQTGAAAGSGPLHPSQPLIEPLSDREREVLHLIAQGLSNDEIGERLFLALNTVKGHNQRIFGKLQVQRRTEAVARARELGLL